MYWIGQLGEVRNGVGEKPWEQPLPVERTTVRMARGARCETPQAVFKERGVALQFPYYLGENWNAFDE